MREMEMTARTVEEAVEAACAALGVDRDDLNVSYEVLEMPARRGLFKVIPARVRVTVEESETAAPAPESAAPAPAEPEAQPAPETPSEPAAQPEQPEAAAPAEAPAEAPAPETAADGEQPLDIAADPRLQAAVDYLTPIFTMMGAHDFTFRAGRKGEATILHVEGDRLGALIGRRGETMESLSYLASLVVNRMEGPYVKLGIDVGGYRDKREEDLAALARRISERVIRTGCYYEMEPMNPYERHIIHTAVAGVEGVRSESKGEGPERRVVIYSTDPDACNLPDRDSGRRRGGRGGSRGGRSGRGNDRQRGGRPGRGSREGGNRSGRGGSRRGPRASSVPAREFAETPRDPEARPQAPARTEHIHDGDEFEMFGKIEL
ncbi:MAG: RNA-binding cell elongation regulator Jag/EloR [Gemmiger sp.]|uniref:RNA-binding cell elongation regulator Jag/EloR n=1 Tax=Gemmiger sp. TaxID=2049027 RepID=UPI002E7864C4|nr:RNA-binding cell elongation regulator Jag/EloR [Gemmiger sp.]MEE0800549.1 RNA-binding cell elongation regulator Jag/EloR [Gemmiger sp.]